MMTWKWHGEWLSAAEYYPEPEERVLIVTDDHDFGIGIWHPDAGWLMSDGQEEMEVEPLYWMSLPPLPDLN